MIRVFGIYAATCFALLDSSGQVYGNEPDLEDVKKSWVDNQSKVDSVVVKWNMTELKGERRRSLPGGKEIIAPAGERVHTRELYIKGNKIKFETKGPEWNAKTMNYETIGHTVIWDGKKNSDFRSQKKTPFSFVHAINKMNSYPDLRPLQYYLRPDTSSWYEFDPKKYRIVEQTESDRGKQETIVFETNRASGYVEVVTSFSCDLYEGRILLTGIRAERIEPAEPILEYEIKYDVKEEIAYPREWKRLRFRRGSKVDIEYSEVSSIEFDIPIDDRVFEQSYPPGTQITDLSSPDGKTRKFVVDDNGNLQNYRYSVTPASPVRAVGANAFEDSETEDSASRRTIGILLVNLAVAAVLIIYAYKSNRKKR